MITLQPRTVSSPWTPEDYDRVARLTDGVRARVLLRMLTGDRADAHLMYSLTAARHDEAQKTKA